MKRAISITLFFFAISAAHARCAPRAIDITYKADGPVPLTVHRVCGGTRCGLPLARIGSGSCTEIFCGDGSRCNTCRARLVAARDLPEDAASVRWGIFFGDNPVAAYTFSADWSTSDRADWFNRNGWVSGCKPRVGCVTRGMRCTWKEVHDVAITTDGCYNKLFLKRKKMSFR